MITTAVNILPLGFQMSAFYYLPREKERAPAFVLNIVLFLSLIGIVVCAVLMVYPGVLRYVVGSGAGLEQYATLIGLTIFTWMASSFLEIVATAQGDVKVSTTFIIAAQLAKTLFLLVAAFTFHTIYALLIAAILQGVIQLLILIWYLNREFPGFGRRFDPAAFREQAAYVLPFGISAIVATAQSDLHSFLVAHRFTPPEYAIYSVGAAQLPLVALLGHAVNLVMLTKVSSLQSHGDDEGVRILLFRAVRKLSMVYIPVTAALFVLGKDFIETMYTSAYLSSWPILALNLALLPLAAMNVDAVLRAYAQFRFKVLVLRIAMVALLVVTSLAAMDYLGMIGAMLAFVVCGALERLILFSFCARMLGATSSDWWQVDVVKVMFAAGCAAWATYLICAAMIVSAPQARFFAGAIVFSLIYTLLIGAFRVLEQDEKHIINGCTARYLRFEVFR